MATDHLRSARRKGWRHGMLLAWLVGASTQAAAVEIPQSLDPDPERILVPTQGLAQLPADGYLVLDTGCGLIALDPAAAALLQPTGVVQRIQTAAGIRSVPAYETRAFTVAGMQIPAGTKAVSLPLDTASTSAGYRILGMLGSPVLEGRILDVDPDVGCVQLLDHLPAGIPDDGWTTWSWEVGANASPVVHVQVGHRTLSLLLDTGSNEFIAAPRDELIALAREGTLALRCSIGNSTILGGGWSQQMLWGTIAQLHLCGAIVHRALISTSSNATGRIGMGLLSNFHCIFDYPGHRLLLRPAKTLAHYCPPLPLPFTLRWQDGKIWLVVPRSLAAAAGDAQDGDELIAIEGSDVHALGVTRAKRLLQGMQTRRMTLRVRTPGASARNVQVGPFASGG